LPISLRTRGVSCFRRTIHSGLLTTSHYKQRCIFHIRICVSDPLFRANAKLTGSHKDYRKY